ncbi:Hypothetical Protein FCC1311_047592 [Hondaea fermentalgiana]|uniref:Impact N-terminal domain-containing protein n=1 Tax=Hondaea fermentalgiana TaxID=2315210 RepID=A0A2R5GC12_9STRA|nr:Hypothetical Protein FCC1311_047592 [Hondaea fermentalgiana]|eukprot:GBG28536.1 Hypothetical Protein FCC1311_047592 [Hondaea fermentalgiana]
MERGPGARAPRRVKIAGVAADVVAVEGEALEDRGSVFKGALVYPVRTAREAAAAVAWMRQQADFAGATHRVAAYRTTGREEWRDDDGEDRAGGRLRGELRREKVLGAAVVVARWYGGQNLGKPIIFSYGSVFRISPRYCTEFFSAGVGLTEPMHEHEVVDENYCGCASSSHGPFQDQFFNTVGKVTKAVLPARGLALPCV